MTTPASPRREQGRSGATIQHRSSQTSALLFTGVHLARGQSLGHVCGHGHPSSFFAHSAEFEGVIHLNFAQVAGATDSIPVLHHTRCVNTSADHKVLSADLCRDGVLVVFDNGKTAIFPPSLLYASLDQAVKVLTDDEGPAAIDGV